MVPHSHQDPGWVKTFDQYYEQQVRTIFNTMAKKLNEHRDFRFIYAEVNMNFISHSAIRMLLSLFHSARSQKINLK